MKFLATRPCRLYITLYSPVIMYSDVVYKWSLIRPPHWMSARGWSMQ